MFKFVKQTFILAMMFFIRNLPGVNSLSCILMKNQDCKVRLEIVNVNSNEPVFYPFSVKTSTLPSRIDVTSPQYSENFPPTILLFQPPHLLIMAQISHHQADSRHHVY